MGYCVDFNVNGREIRSAACYAGIAYSSDELPYNIDFIISKKMLNAYGNSKIITSSPEKVKRCLSFFKHIGFKFDIQENSKDELLKLRLVATKETGKIFALRFATLFRYMFEKPYVDIMDFALTKTYNHKRLLNLLLYLHQTSEFNWIGEGHSLVRANAYQHVPRWYNNVAIKRLRKDIYLPKGCVHATYSQSQYDTLQKMYSGRANNKNMLELLKSFKKEYLIHAKN